MTNPNVYTHTFRKRSGFICGCVFPVYIFKKVVLQQQITIIFGKRKQPPKKFFLKTYFSTIAQILKNISEEVQILTKLLATLIKMRFYIDISQ